ncbi:MAG: LysM peptidoglycan-binding domain-containing protein [Candidatus Sericytochromatia bacterium]|nr:LysM peptidoglycan-binding domain-containing protein [Candidatus Sericytochromatia bacterium]
MNAKEANDLDQDMATLHALLATAGNDFSRTFRVVLKEQDWLVEAMPESVRRPKQDRSASGMATFTLAAGLSPMLPTTQLDDLVPPPPSLISSAPAVPGTSADDDWSYLAPVETVAQARPAAEASATKSRDTRPKPDQGMNGVPPGETLPALPYVALPTRTTAPRAGASAPAVLPPAVAARPIELPPLPGRIASRAERGRPTGGVVALGPAVPESLLPLGPVMPENLRPLGPSVPADWQPPTADPPEFANALSEEAVSPVAAALTKPQQVRAASSGPRWHVIRSGETLIQLARRYYDGKGRHWMGLFAFNRNRIRSADQVFPGDRIQIPSQEVVAALSTTRQAQERKPGRLAALGKDLSRRRTRIS